MKTITTIQENAEDIYTEAQQINEERAVQEDEFEDKNNVAKEEKGIGTLFLFLGTCCHWRANFGEVILLPEPDFHVVCVFTMALMKQRIRSSLTCFQKQRR